MTDPAIQQYVATHLLPAMAIAGRPFTIDAPATAGTRSSVHLVRVDGLPPLLLRVHERRGQALRNAEALRHLERLDLPAPRLVFEEPSRRTRLLPSAAATPPFITVETWIDGVTHAAIEDPAVARDAALKVASLLSRYHAVTRPVWGRPGRPLAGRLIGFGASTMTIARRMLRSLAAGGWLAGAEAEVAQRTFASWRDTIDRLTPFSLVHNDANRRNFILTRAGEVLPVDLHRLGYEPFVEEVINALYHFCRKDADLAARFLAVYLERTPESSRECFDRTRGFFEPLNYLKKMARRAGTRPAADDAKMAAWRGKVLAIAPPPGPPA